jgi:hypothetical protein
MGLLVSREQAVEERVLHGIVRRHSCRRDQKVVDLESL